MAACLLMSGAAQADDVTAYGYLGGFGISAKENVGGGALAGVAASYRHGWLLGGAHGDLGVGLPWLVTNGGICLGLSIPGASVGFRAELVGIGGVRYYEGWGRALLFSHDPGVNAWIPHAGGMARLAYAVGGEQRSHFEFGVLARFERDLVTVERRYTYREIDWLSGDPEIEDAHHVVGGDRFVVALTLGAVTNL